MLEDRRSSRGGEDGGRSRELMQQFSVLHYVVLVHNCVNKVYIAVLQLLVKLRPISRTSFGHESDIWRSAAVDRIGFAGQDLVSCFYYCFFILFSFVYFSVNCTLCIFVFYNHCCLVRINKWNGMELVYSTGSVRSFVKEA